MPFSSPRGKHNLKASGSTSKKDSSNVKDTKKGDDKAEKKKEKGKK
jgi:hypothetical protein